MGTKLRGDVRLKSGKLSLATKAPYMKLSVVTCDFWMSRTDPVLRKERAKVELKSTAWYHAATWFRARSAYAA